MAYSRREIAPADQIKALRHARDHYVQLADRIHNDPESVLDAVEKQLREDDARRIAKAYDRSLSNNVDRMSRMEGTHRSTVQFFERWYRTGALLLLALASLLLIAYQYPSLRDGFSKLRDIGTIAMSGPGKRASPAGNPPPAVIAQNPLPPEPDVSKNFEPDAHKPAVAAPKKIVQPRAPVTKEAAPRDATNARPAAAKRAAPKPAEAAKAVPPAATQALPPVQPVSPPPIAPAPVEIPAPPVAAAIPAPIPPPAAIPSTAIPPAPQAIRPEPITETHTLPRYPSFSAQAGETGTTRLSVAITPQGLATDCRITQSSGSGRLDGAACAHVTDHWRWKPFGRDSTAPAPRISVTMVWNLSRPGR